MKKNCFLSILINFLQPNFAQKPFRESVWRRQKPLPSASVTIEEIGKMPFFSYAAITDSKGNYSVTFF